MSSIDKDKKRIKKIKNFKKLIEDAEFKVKEKENLITIRKLKLEKRKLRFYSQDSITPESVRVDIDMKIDLAKINKIQNDIDKIVNIDIKRAREYIEKTEKKLENQ